MNLCVSRIVWFCNICKIIQFNLHVGMYDALLNEIQINWAGASRRDIQTTVLTEEGAFQWSIGLVQPRLPQTRHSSLGRTVHHNGRPDFIDNVTGLRAPPRSSSTTVSCRTIVGRFGAIGRLREPNNRTHYPERGNGVISLQATSHTRLVGWGGEANTWASPAQWSTSSARRRRHWCGHLQ